MNIKETKKYINTVLLSKQEILESIDAYITHCKTSTEEDWSDEKRIIMVNILNKFIDIIKDKKLPKINDKHYYYRYSWLPDGIILELEYCDEFELDKEGEIHSSTSTLVFVVAEVKCEYLTVEEYATKYNISDTTVRQWIRRGKIRTAKKVGRDWLIPELADKPKRGYEPVTYSTQQRIPNLVERFPYLKDIYSITIIQSNYDKTIFEVYLKGKYGDISSKILMGINEREKLELALISEPTIGAEEFSTNIQFVPKKNNYIYIIGGKLMTEKEYNIYIDELNIMNENDLELHVSNFLYNEDGMHIWGFSIDFLKNTINNDECVLKSLVTIHRGTIIPAELDFSDDDIIGYSSAAALCDAMSSDMINTYTEIANIGEGIKPEVLKEFQMDENEAIESSIIYIDNIEVSALTGLEQFLKVFDLVIEGLPCKNCGIAVILLAWDTENGKVKTFLENGWKIKNVDSNSIIVYKGIK